MLTFRRTPFATGPDDDPTKILTRIADGNINLHGGTWDGVTDLAKVPRNFQATFLTFKVPQ